MAVVDDLLNEMALKENLTAEQMRSALSLAIEQVLAEIMDTMDISVDIDRKVALAAFTVGHQISLTEALSSDPDMVYHDPHVVQVPFSSFSPQTVASIGRLFRMFLMETARTARYRFWAKQVRQAVEGVVVSRSEKAVEIELMDRTCAVMEKHDWVPSEVDLYYTGNVLSFWVSKVQRNPLGINLSRASIALPAALLKGRIPGYQFTCKRRYIGQKSVVLTNAPIDNSLARVRGEVSRELNGELVVIKSYPKH